MLGGEAAVATEDDVDNIFVILKSLSPRLVSLLVFLVLPLAVLIWERCIEGLAEANTLEERVLGLRVYQALLVSDLLELGLLVPRLLPTLVALDIHDFLVWLALSGGFQVGPLAFVGAVPVAALVVVALGEAFVLLVFQIGPLLHHVPKLHGGSRAIASEVAVDMLQGKAVLEAMDDVLVGDVGDGCTYLEETPSVGPQGLILFLLDLRQIMASTCSEHGALEVVDEDLLRILSRVNGVELEAFEPGEWCRFQSHRKIDDLSRVGAADTSMAVE
jgi:hypothetical protein